MTALRAVAQLARVASFISVAKNRIGCRETPILLNNESTLSNLRYLEIPSNQIGVNYLGEPLGLRWTEVEKKPMEGIMLKCDALSKAIHGDKGKREFTAQEIDDFNLTDGGKQVFNEESYIKDMSKGWFVPSPMIPPGKPNEGMDPLVNAITNGLLPKLKGLEVRNNQFSKKAIKALAAAIQKGMTPNLVSVITDRFEINAQKNEQISLANLKLDDVDLSIITELFTNGTLPACTIISLVGNSFSLAALDKLVVVLKQPTYLRWTALEEAPTDGEEVKNTVLQDGLRAGQLVFSRSEVGVEEGVQRSWDAFVYAPPLGDMPPPTNEGRRRSLSSFMGIPDAEIPPPSYFKVEQTRRIFSLVGQKIHDVIHLSLTPRTHTDQKLTDLDMHLFGHSLESAHNLELLLSLDLSYNAITKDGLAHLMQVFERIQAPNVTTLSLNNNQIEDEGICAMAAAFAKEGLFNEIEVLSLQNNSFGDVGLNAILDEVKNQGALAKLKQLSFGGGWMGGQGMGSDIIQKLTELLSAVDAKSNPIYWPKLNQLTITGDEPAGIRQACNVRGTTFVNVGDVDA